MAEAKQLYLFDFLNGAEAAQDPSGLPFYPDPHNDNECLLHLQYEYIVKKDKHALSKIYTLSKNICIKIIKKIGQKNPSVRHLPSHEIEEKAHNAASYIIIQYLTKKGWFIKTSFTGYLFLRVQHELFYRTKIDGIIDFIGFDGLTPAG